MLISNPILFSEGLDGAIGLLFSSSIPLGELSRLIVSVPSTLGCMPLLHTRHMTDSWKDMWQHGNTAKTPSNWPWKANNPNTYALLHRVAMVEWTVLWGRTQLWVVNSGHANQHHQPAFFGDGEMAQSVSAWYAKRTVPQDLWVQVPLIGGAFKADCSSP